jgi:alkaline phosphatase D
MQRRDLCRAALGLALMPWLSGCARAPALPDQVRAARWPADPFALGVASGQPRPDGVVLWTRLAPAGLPQDGAAGPRALRYEVYADDGLRKLVRHGLAQTDAARGFSVHVDLRGLAPGRDYWFRFLSGDAISPVGRTRTAPALGAEVARLRLALASCQHYEQGYYAAHREIARQDLDFVLFAGDYIYEGSNPNYLVRSHTGGVPHTLDEYRQRHALYKSDPDLQAAHAAHPWITTWDDHEVVNDYANDRDPRYTEPALFLRRRAAAYQAYFEHMPLRLGPDPATGGQSMRIHDQYRWGQLAELWTLDCRQYRSHHACPDPLRGGGRVVMGCDELGDPGRSMLGADQEQWLARGLADAGGAWKLVAQSTQISSTGIDTPAGRSSFTEAWDGYPAARERLLRTVADARLTDVVTLGGDVHMNVAADLRVRPNDPASPVVASEFVTTSISSRGLGETMLSRIRASNPDIRHARADERGYTLIELTPQRLQAEFRATPHPARADSQLQTQARFAVQRGRAGVQAA